MKKVTGINQWAGRNVPGMYQDGGQTKKKDIIDRIAKGVDKATEKIRDPKGKCKGKIWYSPTPPFAPDPCWRQGMPPSYKKDGKKKPPKSKK
jgi:hypothetical protein